MKRTSLALKRLGVPVLAVTTLMTGAQVALGTSAFAAENGTLTITPSPGFGTASPAAGTGDIQQSVTYTPGNQSVNKGQQTITITVSGSATIVNPTPNTQPNAGGQVNQNQLVIAGNGKSATCTTTEAPPSPNTAPPVVQGCNFAVHDIVSEAVTVTAHDSTDQTTPDATATDNFAFLQFDGCPSNTPDVGGNNAQTNCVSQQGAGSNQSYTVTYFEAGAPAAGKEVDFTIADNSNGANFPTNQSGNTTATSSTTARCTTDANGKCSVTVQANASAASSANPNADITATTANTAPYPLSQAQERVNFVPSTTAGRFEETGSVRITPTPTAATAAVNMPGYAVQNTYKLSACAPNTTTGQNTCAAGTALAGQSVTLSVDHGFFTPVCTKSGLTNYANCTFDPAPAAGAPVGNLASLGQSITATTDAQGNVTVALGIARDAAFDNFGNLVAHVTAVSGGVTLAESVPGQSANAAPFQCNNVGQSGNANNTANSGNNNAPGAGPQAGCATGTPWTTNAAPLNGGTVQIVSIPNTSTEPALASGTTANNVPNNQTRTIVLHLTDQFGNLTSGGATSGVTLTKTGVGDLYKCGAFGQQYNGQSTCTNQANTANTNTTDANGQTTSSYTNVRGSYLDAFGNNADQTRFQSTATPFQGGTAQTGAQTLTASWAAPTTTFNTFAAGPPAVATYATGTKTVTDTVTINYYSPTEQAVVTFSTTPSNSVDAGTVVTVSATVKDQFGNPIAGDNVTFVRSGPNPNNGTDCSATNGFSPTNAQGQAGFSFTCNTPGTQVVTIVVTDNSGNELARGTQTIEFTGTSTTGKHSIRLKLACFSRHPHVIKCVAETHARTVGAKVTLYNKRGHKIRVDDTNRAGKAVFKLKHKRSGKTFVFQAHVRHTATTFAADSKRAKVTVQ